MYTIEHNCKVYDFGDVHKDFLNLLTENWRYVLQRDIRGREEDTEALGTSQRQGHTQDQSDDEDDEDDDDDYDDNSSEE
jgi:hypothetical protein